MKQFLIILALIPVGFRIQAQPGFEGHYSVNRPFGHTESNTYYGVGIGANVLFRDASVFNIKTGLEVNYFHTWDDRVYSSHMSSRTDLHYRYAVVSIPAFLRLTVGNKMKVFIEGGTYLGVSPGGQVRYTYTSYSSSPNDPTTTHESKDSYKAGLFISPAIGLGTRFHLSERLDVFLKGEFAFVQSRRFSGNTTIGAGYGGSYDFNHRYTYLRLCAGIHLKPKPDK